MRQKLVLGLAGLLVGGIGLTGCQSAPRQRMASTGTPNSQMTSGQTMQAWDNKTTPAGQVNNMATAGNGMARPATPAGSPTLNLDPNALPRTSQDAVPRQVGNQTSSYTTFPNTAVDNNGSGRGMGQSTGYQSSAPAPSTSTFQRPASGFTQTGFATAATGGQASNPVPSTGGPTSSTVLPGREEFAVTPPAPSASAVSVPTPPAGSNLPAATRPATSSTPGAPGGAARDEFPPPDVPGSRTDLQIPMPPQ